eukprot:11592697-Alexandrium_andersonii.AAC.1
MALSRSRPRSDMEPSELAGLLRPFVRSPVFLRYPEQLSAPMRVDLLTAHREMLLVLQGSQQNLAFAQK